MFQPKADKAKAGRPPKQAIAYAVTFEQGTQAPVTVRGEILGSTPQRSAYLAIRDARTRAKGQRWTSLVCLLEKRGRQDGPVDSEAEP